MLNWTVIMINIQWDKRMHVRENKDRRKKIEDKLLLTHRGKFMVDYKKLWGKDNSYDLIPTDNVCILKEEDNLEKTKELIIAKLKSVGFNLKISTINGGETLHFESDSNNQSSKILVKLYSRTKNIMIQRTPDCQSLFLKYFKEIPTERKHDSPPFKEKDTTSQNEIKNNFLPQKEPVTLSRPVPVVQFDTDNKTSSKDQSKEVKD